MSRLALPVFVVWLIAVCFVPYWIGVEVGVGWSAATIAALAVAAVLLPLREIEPGLVDLAVAFVVLAYVFAVVIGDASLSAGVVLITQWCLGYLAGRAIMAHFRAPTVSLLITLAVAAVALLAIVEFMTGTNVFVLWESDNPLYSTWGDVQERGGVSRVEGAFGHSLALGGALSLAIPFALSAPLPGWQRALIALTLLTGVTLTFSRTAMVCAIVAVLFSVLLQSGVGTRRQRVTFLTGASVVGVVAFPLIGRVFEAAGDEADNSAAYRGELFSLLPHMQLIGQSPAFQRTPDGKAYFGTFRSIDSAIILTGLTYGLVPLLLLGAVLFAGVVLLVRGEASAGTVAVVAQIPALATVAFITQYTILFWCVVGAAVTGQQLLRAVPAAAFEPSLRRTAPSLHPTSRLTKSGTS
ncbi:hypothetical protein FVA74_02105 [Salinibacterium sp. dk2585]|uniref:hypothetical protein n=1 Tax=unclassified Salinibacterium TaxID=2632331 RepID=UPI0011C246B5|nr:MULTISPECIES: hypothetical protein [unclassified Salinibacterium]QEE60497.1 hypothetical protein FVA74_02105 [Salinibacterium sp. dk2585]TXK55569.1 hypothetical protein FVP63_02250 [Salinibacterium sp. dk5596]